MFAKSKEQNIYIELTNKIHGGENWGFGECLWSPVFSVNNKGKESKIKPWEIMKAVRPGDIIFHSLKTDKGHQLQGVSIVKGSYNTVYTEPPIPAKWGGRSRYYKIPLEKFSPFKNKIYLKDFLNIKKIELTKAKSKNSFYTSKYKTAQKYLATINDEEYKILLDYLNSFGIDLFDNILVVDGDIQSGPEVSEIPARVTTSYDRIVRNTTIINELKNDYKNICQICGKTINLPNGKLYSEGHHLKKLGGLHAGSDTKDNVIILCPSHHVEFDYGSIAINPVTKKIEHIDKSDFYNGKDLNYQRKDINNSNIKYHYEKIFIK